MIDPNFTTQQEGLNFNSVVEAIIKRSCIIDYGIIQKVYPDNEGIVDVSVAVAPTEQAMMCMTCVLANTASSALTVNIKPTEGDRVLIVYPRLFDDEMFKVAEDEDKRKELIINFNAKGYNLTSGIAILLNQCKANYKNVITVEKGNITAKLNKVEVTTTADGDITVDNGKATVNVDKNGNVSVNAQGKYSIKNGTTDLMKVIDELAKAVEQLTTTGSETAQSASPATVAQVATWRTSQLNQLFSAPVTP